MINGKQVNWVLYALEGIGIAFVILFLASYLGGLFMVPQTTVLHSVPEIKMTLTVLGGIFLILIFIAVIFKVKKYSNNESITSKQRRLVTPLTIGILTVTVAYFLFTLHSMFMLSWVGEWNLIGGGSSIVAFWVFLTDVAAGVFLVFRFLGSLIAVLAVSLYFSKKGLHQATMYKLLKVILVFEGLYWVGLLPSGIWGILPFGGSFNPGFIISTGLPCMVASIGIPISLFIFAFKLSPNKPVKGQIKWVTIAGVFYALSFWLNNSGMWIITVMEKGFGFVTNTPQFLVSFLSTLVGLLALTIFTAYFAVKSIKAQTIHLPTVGAILTSLGIYFLWNYLTWIFFGGWNQWYAWILGHNLDLWMLSLPLLGIPLLFYVDSKKRTTNPLDSA